MTRRTTTGCLLTAALLTSGCGGGEDDAGPERPAQAAVTAVTIKDFTFAPEALTVARGATVTFTNEDKAPHTATSAPGKFDTGVLKQGQARKVTLGTAGQFTYICSLHPYMKATLTVTG